MSAAGPFHECEKDQPKGDPRFHALLKEIGDLHDLKQADYGRSADPFANVRASADFGIAPWKGCMIRANDKMKRIQKFAQTETLKNESVEDSLKDLAVYALIALVLFREETNTYGKGAVDRQDYKDAQRYFNQEAKDHLAVIKLKEEAASFGPSNLAQGWDVK